MATILGLGPIAQLRFRAWLEAQRLNAVEGFSKGFVYFVFALLCCWILFLWVIMIFSVCYGIGTTLGLWLDKFLPAILRDLGLIKGVAP